MLSKAVIVIPTLNEAAYIGALLRGLLNDGCNARIWVFDGGSCDSTREIVLGYTPLIKTLKLFDNPGVTQAHAVNRAATLAHRQGALFLVRLDAHAGYPPGYVSALLNTLVEKGADSVVVPRLAVGDTPWCRAAADLQGSWLGHGGAAHRTGRVSGWVDHGHHAAFRLSAFLSMGGYDADFAACEDREFDFRLKASGGRIFLDRTNPIAYRPRNSPVGLWRQTVRNGWYRVKVGVKHGFILDKPAQLPLLVVLTVGLSVLVGLAVDKSGYIPAVSYIILIGFAAVLSSYKKTPVQIGRVIWLTIISHFGFAFGALRAMLTWFSGISLFGPRLAQVPK